MQVKCLSLKAPLGATLETLIRPREEISSVRPLQMLHGNVPFMMLAPGRLRRMRKLRPLHFDANSAVQSCRGRSVRLLKHSNNGLLFC